MSVTQVTTNTQPDAAPLWLPRHDDIVVEQAASRMPDLVEGYSRLASAMAAFLGSRPKMIVNGATALSVLIFLSLAPTLLGAGVGTVVKLAFYQSWTMAIMMAASARVRSVALGTIVRYWFAGMFTTTVLVYFLTGPLASLAGTGDRTAVWISSPLEELIKVIPLVVAVLIGRRAWRHPGLSDFMLLGFAVGAGYAFHADVVWQRATLSGFEANAGLFAPTIYQPDGIFAVGHALWTSLIGFSIGLFLLHRHQAWAVVVGAVVPVMVVGDHMAINDDEGTLDVIRQLLFNGKLVALVFLAAVAAAIVLDQRRLAAVSARDHLFPSDRALRAYPGAAHDEDDLFRSFLSARYRRRRNGVHTTVDAVIQQWPPRCESHPAPIAELARLGRAADVAVGPGTSSHGWAPDPEDADRLRFVGPNGFTMYTAGDEPPPSETPQSDLETDHQSDHAELLSSSTATSTTSSRPEAGAAVSIDRASEFWQYVGLGAVAVALYGLVRLLTAGDASTSSVVLSNLDEAPTDPALIRSLLGALAAAVALYGREIAQVGKGWAAGPSVDPTPHRPDECEA